MAGEAKRRRFRAPGEQAPAADGSALVTIEPGSGSEPALFCVHAEAGDVSLYYPLAGHLAREQTVFGLCAPSADELGAHVRLEQLAERHVREIRVVQADGPYTIVGECTGGALAYEIAQQLRAAGQQVALLALVDAFAPGMPRLARLMPRPVYRIVHRSRILGFHLENLIRLGASEKLAYTAAKAGRARKALIRKARVVVRRSTAQASPQLVFREALAAYEPQPYAGSMVLFRAASMPLGSQAPADLGWRGLVREMQIETLPGYFTTPISEPGVRVLADKLSQHLAERSRER